MKTTSLRLKKTTKKGSYQNRPKALQNSSSLLADRFRSGSPAIPSFRDLCLHAVALPTLAFCRRFGVGALLHALSPAYAEPLRRRQGMQAWLSVPRLLVVCLYRQSCFKIFFLVYLEAILMPTSPLLAELIDF
jgi:hypothetical protein